jgi:hypothetical protein
MTIISITITEVEGPCQRAVHRRMRRKTDTHSSQPSPQGRFEMAGDRDHAWRGLRRDQPFDEGQLAFRSQGGLEQDHLVALPGLPFGLVRCQGLDGDLESRRGGPRALGKHQVVLDQD